MSDFSTLAGNATKITARGFGWTHAGRKQPALADIDLVIEPGERVLLCGDSGSGKSTLLAAMAGVLGSDEEGTRTGDILLEDSTGMVEEPGCSIPVGLVLQDPDSQVISARVGDDIAFGCENLAYPREEIWRRVAAAKELVGPFEPTANLDPAGARDVVRAVSRLVEETGATLVVVEHQHAAWDGVLDRAVELDRGRIVADTSFAEVAQRRQVSGLPQARRLSEAELAQRDAALWSTDLVTRYGPPRTIALPAGASTVITGPNGAGKSTWLMTMAGLLPAKSGEIGVADFVRRGVKGSPLRWKSRELADRIGFVFQNPEHQFVARTVAEELRVAPKVMRVDPPEERIAQLVESLRLEHLLDEPTFGQDPQTFVELVRLLRQLADDGTTIASITHDPLFIQALGDHRVEVHGA